MKANELRIGNIVLNDGQLYVIKHGYEIYDAVHQFSPVKLTEEWLLKFGFKREDEFSCIILKVNDILQLFGNAHGQVALTDNSIQAKEMLNVRCESVHQLQNLYFDLTGEELEISTDS